jgi:hypothetical protein
MSKAIPPILAETLEPRPPQHRKPHRTAVRIVVLLSILAVGAWRHFSQQTHWSRFYGLVWAGALAVYIAVLVGPRRLRDVAAIGASILFGLAAVEAYFIYAYRTTSDRNTPGFSVGMPVLGWGPSHPGVYHHTKTDIKTGRVIFDVDYTIDQHFNRKVDSPSDAPTVAIAGGSAVFGNGVPDGSTIAQGFADALGLHLHVVSLAFDGYGAQQFLRTLETGIRDDTLTRMRVFVFVSGLDLVDRGSCVEGFNLRAPRYELVDGKLTFRGTCAERWSLPLRWLFETTSLHDIIAPRLINVPVRDRLDLYVAMLIRAGQIAREKYGAPTAILYMPNPRYARDAGTTDGEIAERLRAGGLIVIDGGLNPAAFPGRDLSIPGDGHPTAVANRARAQLLAQGLGALTQPAP